MKIIRCGWLDGEEDITEFSIREAVNISLIEDSNNNGRLEKISYDIENCRIFISNLIQMLYDNKCLTDDNIKSMLSYEFKVKD